MSKTFGNILYKVQVQRDLALKNARADLLERNGLTERDIDGINWEIREETDTRKGVEDMVQVRLYKLHDAETSYIEGMVRARAESGIENMPQIKNRGSNG